MSNLKQSKEELDAVLFWRGKHAVAIKERDALQQRLTAADERVDVLEQEVERLNHVKLTLKELAESRADNCSVYRAQLSERDALLNLGLTMINRGIVSFDDQLEYRQKLHALNTTAEGCVHEFIPFTEGCSNCGEPYTAEGASHEA